MLVRVPVSVRYGVGWSASSLPSLLNHDMRVSHGLSCSACRLASALRLHRGFAEIGFLFRFSTGCISNKDVRSLLQVALETRSSPSRWVFGSLPSCSPYIRSPTPVPSTCSPATTFNIEPHKSTMDIARQARLQSRRQAKIDASRNSTANHHAPPVLSISLCQHLSSVVVIHTQAHNEHHATGRVEIPQTSRRECATSSDTADHDSSLAI